MNKRQRKKENKKWKMFSEYFVTSYKDYKQMDRGYKSYINTYKHNQRKGKYEI